MSELAVTFEKALITGGSKVTRSCWYVPPKYTLYLQERVLEKYVTFCSNGDSGES